MDKRRHRRLATRIEVFFSIAQSGIHAGYLLDYGKGGAFVAFKNPQQNAGASDPAAMAARPLQIHFTLDDKEYFLDGVVAHVGASGIGMRFTHVDALAFSALAEAARRQTISQGKDTLPARDRKCDPKQCAQRAAQLVEASFKEWLPPFLDSFCEALLVLAEQRRGGVDPQALLDAFSWLKSHNTRLLERAIEVYFEAISNQCAGDGIEPELHPPAHAADDHVALSLVEKDVFEDWLMQKVATSRVELALREPLAELGLRIEAYSGKKFREDRHPFSPALLFRVAHEALRANQISQNVEKLFFKMIIETAIENFSRLYDNLNTALVKMGVLPELNVTRHLISKHAGKETSPASSTAPASTSPATSNGRAAAARPKAVGVTAGSRPANAGGTTDSTQRQAAPAPDAFATANRLLQMQRQIQAQAVTAVPLPVAGGPTTTSPLPPSIRMDASTDMLIKALNKVSNELSEVLVAGESATLPAQVLDRLNQLEVGYNDDVRDAITMMDSLVANIADEQRMTGDLRAEFCKMQVPLAALQVADPDIFHAEQHPVRELLNYMALLAEPTSANFKANAETVKNVVHQLMAADPLNEQAVGLIVRDLKKQIEREKSIIERNVQRVVESCEGRQRIAEANEFLLQQINSHLGGRKVPRVLIRLLDAGWRELMRLSLLRDGPQSRSWQTSIDVINDVQCLLGKRPIPEEELHFALDPLIRIIEKGLQKVATPSTDIGAITNAIRMGAQAPSVDLVEVGNLSAKEKRKETPGVYPLRLSKKLQRMKVGQWLEYGVKSEHKKLCQIAWISQQRERFALVNQQGMRVAEVSSEQMLEKLASGDVILLGDGQVTAVEKGLDSLIQKIYDKLSYDTSHDQLTGLLTRKEFEKTLAQSVARAKRNETRYALIYADIIQFKLVNSLCGYEGGDHLLQHVANTLLQLPINGQVCGRIGGNEFAMILQVSNDTEAYRYACQVKAALEADKFTWGKHSNTVMTAISLCTFDSHSNQVLELLRTVETATQIAKTSGLKEVQMVKPGDIRFQERDSMMSWVARITEALEKDQLRLRCQKIAPAAELHPDWLPHFEVLLTVVDDAGVHVPPAEFIKAAEEYGRMADVDRWVINQVLSWMQGNKDQLKKFGGFSINLSGHTLNDDSFLDFIFEQLVRYGVPRNKVIFEITETTAVANLDEAADFISEMKEIGCRFSLDDFGAGQSSYAYLKKLPVDFIKIDGAFVKKIDTDKVDFALVKSITEMGHFLNKHIVAEYVSDQAKYDAVMNLGVDYMQGWHVGKPVMLSELLELELRKPV